MSMALEAVRREAEQLSRDERLALARFLIESDQATIGTDVDSAWDAEIRERVRAVDEGRTEGIPYADVLARVDRRLAS